MTVQTIPEHYQYSVIPHIIVDDASAALEFYKRVFGATELIRIPKPDGKILHAEIKIENSVIMLGDADGVFQDPKTLRGSSVGLHVFLIDVDAHFASAVKAGMEVIQGLQDMFHGDRTCILRDPFGHVWVLLTHKEEMTVEEVKQRSRATQDTR